MTAPDAEFPAFSEPVGPRALGSGFMVICQVVLGFVLLLLWQGASGRLVDNFFISNPLDVARRLLGWIADGSLFLHIWATVYATVMGFVAGAVIGVVLGIWLGVSPFTSRLLNPYLNALNALPKVALAPLFVLWFGLGIESKIALAAVLVLFLVFLNTYAGVREVDQDLIDGARLMKATRAQVIAKVIIPSALSWVFAGLKISVPYALIGAVLVLFLVFLNTYAGVREVDQDLIDGARLMKATRAQVITKVIIPSAMSWMFAGLKISVPYALIGAVLGEMIAANRGLGYLVQFSGSQFDSAGVFAVLFVIALLAVALNFLVEIVQHRMQQWRIVGH